MRTQYVKYTDRISPDGTKVLCIKCKKWRKALYFATVWRSNLNSVQYKSYCSKCDREKYMEDNGGFRDEHTSMEKNERLYKMRYNSILQYGRKIGCNINPNFTLEYVKHLFNVGHCFYCKKEITPETTGLVSRVPPKLGGDVSKENYVQVCRLCAGSKRTKSEEIFLEYLRLFNQTDPVK